MAKTACISARLGLRTTGKEDSIVRRIFVSFVVVGLLVVSSKGIVERVNFCSNVELMAKEVKAPLRSDPPVGAFVALFRVWASRCASGFVDSIPRRGTAVNSVPFHCLHALEQDKTVDFPPKQNPFVPKLGSDPRLLWYPFVEDSQVVVSSSSQRSSHKRKSFVSNYVLPVFDLRRELVARNPATKMVIGPTHIIVINPYSTHTWRSHPAKQSRIPSMCLLL